ncbi:MAG: DegT/DnrJ/EryC1/StrS family aminotransferase [Sphaerochaetaceae bacterium]|jgi:dTDP-4-amino-4,6-dideoxygalactose transaminase
MVMRFEKPTLRRKDMDAVLQAMVDEKIGPGERVSQFVNLLENTMGTHGTISALRSYHDALSISLAVADIGPGDMIGVSALSPAIYRHIAELAGCKLVIGDIDKETGLLAESEAHRMVLMGVKAILLHEPCGNIFLPNQFVSFPIPVIEDVAESFESRFINDEQRYRGDIVVCAFEEQHVVSTGGGAAICCQKEPFISNLQHVLTNKPSFEFRQMTDLNAALGCVQLSILEKHLEKRRELFERYRLALMKSRHALFGIRDIDFQTNGQAFSVILESKPDDVIKFAAKYEVAVRPTFRQCVIDFNDPEGFVRYPNAMPCILRSVSYPIYPFLATQQVVQIERVIAHAP